MHVLCDNKDLNIFLQIVCKSYTHNIKPDNKIV